jgi:hypothetical protein
VDSYNKSVRAANLTVGALKKWDGKMGQEKNGTGKMGQWTKNAKNGTVTYRKMGQRKMGQEKWDSDLLIYIYL